MRVAGLDGFRDGWVAVVVEIGSRPQAHAFQTFAQALSGLADVPFIGIDIPIGLPEQGVRKADSEARRLLGSRRSTLFEVPPRHLLAAPDYDTAKRRAEMGPRPSLQVFRLAPKILEVDAVVTGAGLENRVFEVHPELSFLAMSGTPLPSKKTWNGFWRRAQLLQRQGISIPRELPNGAGLAGPDDVLDAGAVAWTALRKSRGEAVPVPAEPELLAGWPTAIWY